MKCPMCDLGEEHQQADESNPSKTKCKGCGTKFFDRDRNGSRVMANED